MTKITDLIQSEIGISAGLQVQIFKTIFIIVLMALMYSGVRKILYKTIEKTKTYYKTKKIVSYVFIALGFIMVSRVWFKGTQSIVTFLGLFSAGVAIAMKDFILNIAGWAYLIWKSPFKVGDRIEINGIAGDVIDIQLFEFTLLETRKWVHADQSTGRIIYIPNNTILKNPVFNYSGGIPFIWNELPVLITFESNWKKAKEILQDIANEYGETISVKARDSIQDASRNFMLSDISAKPKIYTSMSDQSGITLTIRYVSSYDNRRGAKGKLSEEILNRLENHEDIEYAYKTYSIYKESTEEEY